MAKDNAEELPKQPEYQGVTPIVRTHYENMTAEQANLTRAKVVCEDGRLVLEHTY
jgi:hypothetical protein